MNKEELLHHLSTQVFCRLQPGSHGVGVFAVRDIPAEVDPFPGAYTGDYEVIEAEELALIPDVVQSMVKAYCVFDREAKGWIVPSEGLNCIDISFFLNHSKSPNVATLDGESFFTLREILAGEELLADYDSYSEGLIK